MNKKNLLSVLIILCVCLSARAATHPSTSEFVSNDISMLAGTGDTLWMLSPKGVNFTTAILDSPVTWNGFTGLQGWNIAAGGGFALAGIQSDTRNNPLWLFSQATGTQTDLKSPYIIDQLPDSARFWTVDAQWAAHSFWVACMNGGLLQLDVLTNSQTIFYPGINAKSFTSTTFNVNTGSVLDSTKLYADSANAVAVAADNKRVWLTCRTALWSFNPSDTSWQRIVDSTLAVHEYIESSVRVLDDSTTIIYARAAVNRAGIIDTALVAYNTRLGLWYTFINDAEKISSFTPAAGQYVYILDTEKNNVFLYRDSLPSVVGNLVQEYGRKIDSVDFQYRLIQKTIEFGIASFTLSDIHYSILGADTLFQISSDAGLFYSNNEHSDERTKTPFNYINRPVSLASGLGKTYAYPSILNGRQYSPKQAIFAYNLSKDDYVTIDIFDYNMDHVIRILDKAWRQAGKNRTSGRSTIPMYDCWDGTLTNAGGKPVAPGVYFYRIKTKKGPRAFGKIIVAKNDRD